MRGTGIADPVAMFSGWLWPVLIHTTVRTRKDTVLPKAAICEWQCSGYHSLNNRWE